MAHALAQAGYGLVQGDKGTPPDMLSQTSTLHKLLDKEGVPFGMAWQCEG